MNRYLRYIFIIIILNFGLIWIYANDKGSVKQQQISKIARVINTLDKHYLDSLDIPFLTKKAIISMLAELDPHSKYVSKEQLKRSTETMKGSFGGVGIQFNILRDTLYVVSVIPDGPSEKAGLQQGDRIIKVNDETIASIGLNAEKVMKLLKGDIGTEVKVFVKRKNVDQLLEFDIKRGKIPIKSIDAAYMVNEIVGYIKINRFRSPTLVEFVKALEMLKKKGMKKLILDLQGNPGGYLGSAFNISSQFLGKDKIVVYTKGFRSAKREYRTRKDGKFEKGDLVVLINESSASASEIVAGAIQDWDRGIIVGRRTFGKGLVQVQFKLNDGSAIKITTAKYYTPSGRNIQKPYDIEDKEYHREIFKRQSSGEFLSADSIDVVDSLSFQTLVNKRTVFGGGGIIPDVFIPQDTSVNFTYFNTLIRKNILYPYLLDYIDNHKNEIRMKYPDFNHYDNDFQVSDNTISEIINIADSNKINRDDIDNQEVNDQMKKYMKSNIARILWSNSEYFRIRNQDSKEVNTAIDLLSKDVMYREAFKYND